MFRFKPRTEKTNSVKAKHLILALRAVLAEALAIAEPALLAWVLQQLNDLQHTNGAESPVIPSVTHTSSSPGTSTTLPPSGSTASNPRDRSCDR
jgi:hypothetical protein